MEKHHNILGVVAANRKFPERAKVDTTRLHHIVA
jgi:hypothetical protein